jgi:gamma-glutamyltranspeptidase
MKKKVAIAIPVALIVLLAIAYAGLRYDAALDQARFEKAHAAIDSVISAAFRSSADVRSDLIARGLLVEDRDESGNITSGGVLFGRIGDLIKAGVYHIDQQRALQFGPAP